MLGIKALLLTTHNPDAIRDGHEVVTWDQRSKFAVAALKYGTTGLTTAYLPLSQARGERKTCVA